MKKRIAGLLSLFMIPTMLYNNTGIMDSHPKGLLNGLRAEAADISGRVLYVAENGNDYSGKGSSDAPYRSIKKAADEATAGTTVLIRPGTYIEEDIRPKESGREDAMIAFRPENSSDTGKVIIKHKDVFDGSTVTPQVRTQWLQDTGWSENDVKHYDNAGIEYSIAGRKNQLTDVFNLFGRDYVKIEGFVFEDYKYARSTINIMGKGNVVLNNQFKNIGCVYNAPWTWSNQGVYRPDVTIPVAGPDNVIRNNYLQSVYGETIWLDISVRDFTAVRNVSYNTAYFMFNESECTRNWAYENIVYNRPLDGNGRMPMDPDHFMNFPAQRIESGLFSAFWDMRSIPGSKWATTTASVLRKT